MNKAHLLNAVERGDILYGVAGTGQGMMMLVYETSASTLFTRHVPSQTKAQFGRDGQSNDIDGLGRITLISAAPLAQDVYNTVLGLDRKMRLMHSVEHIRLTEDEKRLLLEIEAFYRARPFPDG